MQLRVEAAKQEEATMKYGWTEVGPCQIVEEDEGRVKIMLPGRIRRSEWKSKTHLIPMPSKIRLVKGGLNFDQKCGCTAVVEVIDGKAETYNVYGSFRKYLKSGTNKGLEATPHHRRMHLKKEGYVRALGSKPRSLEEPLQYVFEKMIPEEQSDSKEQLVYKLLPV
jgi:hypothetical protein